MTAIRTNLVKLVVVPAAVFACTLAVLLALNHSHAPDPASLRLGADSGPSLGSAKDPVAAMQDAIRADPARAAAWAGLGQAYLQRARETSDPAFYVRAQRSFAAARRRDGRNVSALVGAATLANLRHDFSGALQLGLEARRVAPALVLPLTVVADAQIELGRYGEAEHTIQRLIDRKPALPAYARASYYRELTGDLGGAVEAMRLAASAGGAPQSRAYVQALVGDLELQRGRTGAARVAYRDALGSVGSYPAAEVGLARLDSAAGRPGPAAARLRRVTERLPQTGYLILLAETELAAGHRRQGERALRLVRAQQRLLRAAGAVPDAELVNFDARHGNSAAAVQLGRRVWRSAPSVRSADALGWALTRAGRPVEGFAWARRAMRMGSHDAAFRLHAGLAAAGAGRRGLAGRYLRQALAARAALSPLQVRDARRALR